MLDCQEGLQAIASYGRTSHPTLPSVVEGTIGDLKERLEAAERIKELLDQNPDIQELLGLMYKLNIRM